MLYKEEIGHKKQSNNRSKPINCTEKKNIEAKPYRTKFLYGSWRRHYYSTMAFEGYYSTMAFEGGALQ